LLLLTIIIYYIRVDILLKNLKKLRFEKNLSQQQLASEIKVSQQSINKYENHETEPNLATLVMLADYFDTSVDYLIGRTDIRHKIEPVKEYDLNEKEQTLFNYYRQLSKDKKECLAAVAKNMLR
jgi:transcriptional regulator with XRE-family HTH domain